MPRNSGMCFFAYSIISLKVVVEKAHIDIIGSSISLAAKICIYCEAQPDIGR
jgi:hypothetical protein